MMIIFQDWKNAKAKEPMLDNRTKFVDAMPEP